MRGESAPYAVAMGLPHASLSPRAVEAAVGPGETVTRTLTLQNEGFAPLTWSLTGPLPPWAALEPVAGEVPAGGEVSLALALRAEGLTPALHKATLTFTWNDPFAPEGTVQVHLQVTGPPPARRYLPLALRGN